MEENYDVEVSRKSPWFKRSMIGLYCVGALSVAGSFYFNNHIPREFNSEEEVNIESTRKINDNNLGIALLVGGLGTLGLGFISGMQGYWGGSFEYKKREGGS